MAIEYTVIAGDKTTVHLNNYDAYMDVWSSIKEVDEVTIKKRVLNDGNDEIEEI